MILETFIFPPFPYPQLNGTLKENLLFLAQEKKIQIIFLGLTVTPPSPATLDCSARSRQHREQTKFPR